MKTYTTLLLLLASFPLFSQNWVSQNPFPASTTIVQSIEANSDGYSVITLSVDSVRYRTNYDAATGAIISSDQVERQCANLASRVNPQEYILATSDATGFTVSRVRYDEDCQATELFSTRFDLGPVGYEVLVGEGMYSKELDAYFVYGIKTHESPSALVPHQQFLYQLDPTDGMVQNVLEQQDTSFSTPPRPIRVDAVIPNLGVFTQIADADYGYINFTSLLNSEPVFENIARARSYQGAIPKICANSNGDVAFLELFSGHDFSGLSIQKITVDTVVAVERPDFFGSEGVGSYLSYNDLALDENGDLLAIGRLYQEPRGGGGEDGAFLFRMTPEGDSSTYRYFPGDFDNSPTFKHITTTPTQGVFAAGTYLHELFVVKIDAQLVDLFDQPSNLDFAVYPNPATEVVRITNTEVLAEAEPYAIYDFSGRLVTFGSLSGDASIQVADLPAGQYAITLPRLNAVAQIMVQ